MSNDRGSLDLMSLLVLEDGRLLGEAFTKTQWEDAEAVLGGGAGPTRHWISRARGYSKTTDLAAMVIAVMLCQAPPGARLYAAAADRDQARLLLDSMRGFVQRTPLLAGRLVFTEGRAATSEGVVFEILSSDSTSAYGLRPAFLVIDELCQWPDTANARAFYDALVTALPKVPGSRLAIITTSGDPTHWSRHIYESARRDPHWGVSETLGPAPWMDPALIESERLRLPDSTFRRLFLNEWAAADDRLVRPGDLDACATLEGPLEPVPGRRYVIGLDIGITNDRTVAVVCHGERSASDDPGEASLHIVMDRMQVWSGSADHPVQLDRVERWVERESRRYNDAPVVADAWQAIGMTQRLRDAGLKVTDFIFTPASGARLALTLVDLLRGHRLAIPRDPALLEELAAVRLRESVTGVLRMDHDPGRHDDRAIALGLAASHLIEKGVRRSTGRVPKVLRF